MLTLIFTILIIYFLWLVVKPLAAAYIRRQYERKVNDFFRQAYGSAFGVDPEEPRRRKEEPRRQSGGRRPRRRDKIFTGDVGEYVDFVEIDEKIDYTSSSTASSTAYTPREPQVSDAEWEDVK